MDFYILRVILPALVIDIPITAIFLRKNTSVRKNKLLSAFIAVPLYLISAFIWVCVYSVDPRFQGQGALGLIVFLGLGVFFAFLRLLFGLLLLNLKRS